MTEHEAIEEVKNDLKGVAKNEMSIIACINRIKSAHPEDENIEWLSDVALMYIQQHRLVIEKTTGVNLARLFDD